jgi:hypothetical protein
MPTTVALSSRKSRRRKQKLARRRQTGTNQCPQSCLLFRRPESFPPTDAWHSSWPQVNHAALWSGCIYLRWALALRYFVRRVYNCFEHLQPALLSIVMKSTAFEGKTKAAFQTPCIYASGSQTFWSALNSSLVSY